MNVVIGGCGWLGQKVAVEMMHKGHTVYGTFRSSETKQRLIDKNIKGLFYDFSSPNSQISTEIANKTNLVYFALPPLRREEIDFYGKVLLHFLTPFNSDCKVIFSSSTGVYPQRNGVYDEEFVFSGSEDRNCIVHAEEMLTEQLSNRLAILRFGGLIGADRHPIRHLSGRVIRGNGEVAVNLIHAADISRLILKLAEEWHSGIYNVVFPIDLAKRSYYLEAAKELGFSQPNFGNEQEPNRIVSIEKLKDLIPFDLQYSPRDWAQYTELQQN
jgi:nucleoside-diphosphate-sugar epimerase